MKLLHAKWYHNRLVYRNKLTENINEGISYYSIFLICISFVVIAHFRKLKQIASASPCLQLVIRNFKVSHPEISAKIWRKLAIQYFDYEPSNLRIPPKPSC